MSRETEAETEAETPAFGQFAARVLEVEDRLAILNLEGSYAETWDFGDAAGWAALFTDEGVFDLRSATGEVRHRARGNAELRTFCEQFTGEVLGLHLLHTPRITLAGDTAQAHIHFTFESHRLDAEGSTISTVTGTYDVRYRRTAAGWRITQRSERAMHRTSAGFHPGSFTH